MGVIALKHNHIKNRSHVHSSQLAAMDPNQSSLKVILISNCNMRGDELDSIVPIEPRLLSLINPNLQWPVLFQKEKQDSKFLSDIEV